MVQIKPVSMRILKTLGIIIIIYRMMAHTEHAWKANSMIFGELKVWIPYFSLWDLGQLESERNLIPQTLQSHGLCDIKSWDCHFSQKSLSCYSRALLPTLTGPFQKDTMSTTFQAFFTHEDVASLNNNKKKSVS